MTQGNAVPAAADANEMVTAPKVSLLAKMAATYSVDPKVFRDTILQTVIKGKDGKIPTNEQVVAFLIVANQYGLNPFTKEIHAFVQHGAVIPIVGIDGWCNLVNRNDQFNGCDLIENNDVDGELVSVTCIMYRKDREHPVSLTEHLSECKRNTEQWKTKPRRMLRHKVYIQAARYCFGFAGIYDEDEADRIRATGIEDADVVEIDMAAGKDDAHSGSFNDAPKPDDFKADGDHAPTDTDQTPIEPPSIDQPPPEPPGEPHRRATAASVKGRATSSPTPAPNAPDGGPSAPTETPTAQPGGNGTGNDHAANVRLLWSKAHLRAKVKGVKVERVVADACMFAGGGQINRPQHLTPEQLTVALAEVEKWEPQPDEHTGLGV